MKYDVSITNTTATPGRPSGLSDDRDSGMPWYWLAFITVVFFVIDHNVSASVNVPLYERGFVADKAAAVADGSLIRRAAYLAFGLYGVVEWVRPRRFQLSARGVVAAMLLTYLGWAALSLSWSVSPMLSVRRLSVLGLVALGITGLLRQYSGKDIARLILFMTLAYLLIGVASELILHQFTPGTPGYRFAGTLHPNIQGINCAALVFSALTLEVASTRFRPALSWIALVGMVFLLLTGSRGALAGGLAGLATLWVLKTRAKLVLLTVSTLSCAGLLSFFLVDNGFIGSPLKVLLSERIQGDGVLSGRTDLWAILIEYARARPILGYGYGAFFDPERSLDMAARVGMWIFGGPHSLYLGTLVDIGAVGLVCLLAALCGGIARGVRLYRGTREAHYALFIALLVFQMVNGVTEAEMLTPNPHFIPVLAMAFVVFRTPRQMARRDAGPSRGHGIGKERYAELRG